MLGIFFFIVVIVIILWPDMSVGRNRDILHCDECVMGIFIFYFCFLETATFYLVGCESILK